MISFLPNNSKLTDLNNLLQIGPTFNSFDSAILLLMCVICCVALFILQECGTSPPYPSVSIESGSKITHLKFMTENVMANFAPRSM